MHSVGTYMRVYNTHICCVLGEGAGLVAPAAVPLHSFVTQPNVVPSSILPINHLLFLLFASQVTLWKRCLWRGLPEGN